MAAALYGALAGFIAGGIIGGAIEAGIQLSDGTPLHCLDQRAIGKAIAQGAILGAIGGAVAAAAPLLGAGAGGTVALALGVDFAAGMAVDMLWNDMSFREAAISNAAGMFVGGAIGVAAGAAGRAIAKSPAGQAISDRIGRALGRGGRESAVTGTGVRAGWRVDNPQPTNRIPNQSQPYSCQSACAAAVLQGYGIDVSEADVMKAANFDGQSEQLILTTVETMNQIVKDHFEEPPVRFVQTLGNHEDISNYLDRGLPVISTLNRHTVIVDAVDNNAQTVTVLDPFGEGPGSGSGEIGTLRIGRFDELQRRGGSLYTLIVGDPIR